MAVVDKDRVVQLLCSSDWKHAFFLHRGSEITKEQISLVIERPPRNPCAVAITFFIERSWGI